MEIKPVRAPYTYHFWMCGMKLLRRGDGSLHPHRTSDTYRAAICCEMAAFHVYL